MAHPYQNAVILMGNTGCGKSYMCNRIFAICGSSGRFVSSASNRSVTSKIQAEVVSYRGKNYTIMDCPGFFDNNNQNPGGNDGPNLCKLVKALEQCESIVAILYVYTDRFSVPQKIWFDRVNGLVSGENKSNIIMVHNKLDPVDLEVQAENKVEVNTLINDGTKHPYVWISCNTPDDQVRGFLGELEKLQAFKLEKLSIPEICYEKEEEGPEYQEEVGRRIEDHGEVVKTVTDGSYFKTEERWNRNTLTGMLGLRAPGAKKEVQVFVPRMVEEFKHVEKKMTHRTTATYKNIYKVRFDGTKDLKEKKYLGQKDDVF